MLTDSALRSVKPKSKIYKASDRDILPAFQNRLLAEIQAEDPRILCNKVKDRGAPATAVQIRDIVKQVYA